MVLPTKLTVACTFPIHPATGGGQVRALHFYRHLAAHFPVDVISLVQPHEPAGVREVWPGLREVRVPRSNAHAAAEWRLQQRTTVPIGDIAFSRAYALTPAFAQAVRSSAVPGGALVACHPYPLPALRGAGPGMPLWYEAQDVEADLKAAVLPRNLTGRCLVRATRRIERACCRRAALVLAVSADDGERLCQLYGVPPDRLVLVPNGVDTAAIRFTPPAQRDELRTRLRMDRPLALFIGSWHEPNVLAARWIFQLASQLPTVDFAIVGSVVSALRDVLQPPNIQCFGVVDEELKCALLAVASVALNPMSHGSGTNIKMFDYLASGVPVVSTPLGARGLGADLERHLHIAPLKSFERVVRSVLAESPETAQPTLRAARLHVEERFDWRAIANTFVQALEDRH